MKDQVLLITKKCPKCGNECNIKEIVPCLVFGFECNKCGHIFDGIKLYIGNMEADL